MTVTVRTGSRLHFGLLGPPPRAGRRGYGGVGLMVERPGLLVSIDRADRWHAEGPLADRALEQARRYAARAGLGAHHIRVSRAPPPHAGLGTGTQLAAAVVRALTESGGQPLERAEELARAAGRGLRSAIGVHGFLRGGLLVDGGKLDGDTLAPLIVRHDFPEPWRVVLTIPPWGPGLHGEAEAAAFQRLVHGQPQHGVTEQCCRSLGCEILPALAEGNLDAFGEALHDFNRLAGEVFSVTQGGPYASRDVAELVGFLRGLGVRGVGQSSWGPAVFAIVADEDRAQHTAARVRHRFGFGDQEVVVTRAMNTGAVIVRN